MSEQTFEETIARARIDPGAVFTTPEEVAAHPRLTREQKVDLLRRWLYDAAELSVAQEEGMAPTVENDLMRRVSLVLRRVTYDHAPTPSGPTKHGVPAPRTSPVEERHDDHC